jgi:hypothetical protein
MFFILNLSTFRWSEHRWRPITSAGAESRKPVKTRHFGTEDCYISVLKRNPEHFVIC